ncbi:MAG: pyridoxamine 5'-phosphate oxidase [Planctomycetes bacterium]|nr:pyridoxamine 5'-phosphate oxidase [Planctomycetota bacterium]
MTAPTSAPIDFDHPPADPVAACRQWFAEAEQLPLPFPNAMTLATIDPDGRPSARIVLLRGFDERGAVFFTNRQSRKGIAIAANAAAALLFHWDQAPIGRQIRIEGAATHVSDAESDDYWKTRPRESQINAWASHQSHPVANLAALKQAQQEQESRFKGRDVPRPPHWGGYRVSLERIELWQGDPQRLHDRVLYSRAGSGWTVQRLCP